MATEQNVQNVAKIKAVVSRSATTPAVEPLVYATEDTSLPKTGSAVQVEWQFLLFLLPVGEIFSSFFFIVISNNKRGKAQSRRGSRFAIKIHQFQFSQGVESIFFFLFFKKQKKEKKEKLVVVT